MRRDLCSFPEYDLEFFRKRIVRRSMRGDKGMVFGPPRTHDEHWFLYTVGGGDQDEVQLNIGMYPEYIRVGLGFQIGRQVAPKIPAFRVFQTFLGVRPPLPFRAAFYYCVARNGFGIEIQGDPKKVGPDDVLRYLETYVVPADGSPVFVFVGALWDVQEAANKTIDAYREVFLELMPFYEELLLAGGRYVFYSS
ncbi:hypothetical protein [Thermacetogenium phaeum]|uniref:hypothetical protein n=1 Tax=Thermacetogenium phaeum TaxID=85874 RepID=UPI0012DD5912|nr:hypothetical protein [Thermacetogenium phaeum]